MTDVNVDITVDESRVAETRRKISLLDDTRNRKTIIEAANEGLIVALRRHFGARERESGDHSGFPWFGQTYPKKYFWRGTRGTSVAEKIESLLISPARLTTTVAIDSPALAHKMASDPPPIKPKGGRRYLAIPANSVSASWSGKPRDFPGGVRFGYAPTPTGGWLPALLAASNYVSEKGSLSKRGKGSSGKQNVVYWLVHKVKTRHDPHALPSRDTQVAAVTKAVASAFKSILKES